jgi:two-component system cell cycle sensor histidine kinase/response regulator CckA
MEFPGKNCKTILVAEDEEFVRLFLKMTLSKEGFKLIIAENGEDALRKFRKHQDAISLVISDMVMPRMKGRALYEAICKINPHIKMIFISGYSAGMLNLNEMLGAQLAFIPKPFSKGALLGKIRSILGDNCRS